LALRFLKAAHLAMVSSVRGRSVAAGVAHPDRMAASQSAKPGVQLDAAERSGAVMFRLLRLSASVGVGQTAICAIISSVMVAFDPSGLRPPAVVPGGTLCPPLGVVGVGHEPNAVASVEPPEARSRYNSRPDGVATAFQVSRNKIEPRVRFIRLLTKEHVRPADADEPKPLRP
jgi:hypothetical protein